MCEEKKKIGKDEAIARCVCVRTLGSTKYRNRVIRDEAMARYIYMLFTSW